MVMPSNFKDSRSHDGENDAAYDACFDATVVKTVNKM